MTENIDHPEDEVTLSSQSANRAPEADVEFLQRERDELQQLLLRRQADFDNFRRRVEKERLENFEYASMDAVKAMLPVLDDFERALGAECSDKEYARGMELIYQRMLDTLKKVGLEPMDVQGAKFDPHVHHAIEMVSTDEAEDQTVLGELQRGYFFKGRLLRPALVKVAVR